VSFWTVELAPRTLAAILGSLEAVRSSVAVDLSFAVGVGVLIAVDLASEGEVMIDLLAFALELSAASLVSGFVGVTSGLASVLSTCSTTGSASIAFATRLSIGTSVSSSMAMAVWGLLLDVGVVPEAVRALSWAFSGIFNGLGRSTAARGFFCAWIRSWRLFNAAAANCS